MFCEITRCGCTVWWGRSRRSCAAVHRWGLRVLLSRSSDAIVAARVAGYAFESFFVMIGTMLTPHRGTPTTSRPMRSVPRLPRQSQRDAQTLRFAGNPTGFLTSQRARGHPTPSVAGQQLGGRETALIFEPFFILHHFSSSAEDTAPDHPFAHRGSARGTEARISSDLNGRVHRVE